MTAEIGNILFGLFQLYSVPCSIPTFCGTGEEQGRDGMSKNRSENAKCEV